MMDFYLSWNNNAESIRLPVSPESIEVSLPNGNTTVNITNVGEYNLIGKSDLAKITLESFFPAQEYNFCTYVGFNRPYEYIQQINRWRLSGKPIRLIATNSPINYSLAIDEFTYSELDGTGDVYFTIKMSEYKFIQTTTTAEYTTAAGNDLIVPFNVRENRAVQETYTAINGESISTISQKMTGTTNNVGVIISNNRSIIKGNVISTDLASVQVVI